MIYDAIWNNFRKEYQQTDEHHWKWVDKVDVSVASLSFSATVELPDDTTSANLTARLKALTPLKQLVQQAKQSNTSTAFQLTIEESKAALSAKAKGENSGKTAEKQRKNNGKTTVTEDTL